MTLNSAFSVRCCALTFAAGVFATQGLAGVSMLPIGARMDYQVFDPATSSWVQTLNATPGQQIEWRVKISYTGTNQNVGSLTEILYQPILTNIDNANDSNGIDSLGSWRNNGLSGIGNTTLLAGVLSEAEGENGSALSNGYGRVRFSFLSRSTSAGNSGGLAGFRHGGDYPTAGAPTDGSFIRIAGSFNPNWYPEEVSSQPQYQQLLWGNAASNPPQTPQFGTFFVNGTQDLVVFRQALTLSQDSTQRSISILSEAASLRTDSTFGPRYMIWRLPGEIGGSVRVGVEFTPAIINVVPSPASIAVVFILPLATSQRKRRR